MAVGSGLILAGPLDTAAALVRLVPSGEFWGQVAFSALRIVGGAAAGYVCAFALAAVAWRWSAVRTLLQPALSAIKGTPVACVVVLLLIWIGSRNVSAVAVFLMVLPGVYFPVLTGLDELDEGQRELFQAFGAGRMTRLLAHVWPGILPYVTAASRTVLGMSWKAGVAAELIGVPAGSIGERIYQAKLLLETADLFAWTIVVVLISWAFERGVLALLNASVPIGDRLLLAHAGHGVRSSTSSGSPGDVTSFGVKAEKLEIGYDGKLVCSPATFEVKPGYTLCLMAPSGTGKTTLLRTLAGLQEPLAGRVEHVGETGTAGADTLHGANSGQAVGMVFQDTRLIERLTAIENVYLLAGGACDERRTRDLLSELLPAEVLDAPVRELSGGQQRRVELARAFASQASLVLLDEPFTGLDAETHRQALSFIRRHQGNRAIVLATHDRKDVQALEAETLALNVRKNL